MGVPCVHPGSYGVELVWAALVAIEYVLRSIPRGLVLNTDPRAQGAIRLGRGDVGVGAYVDNVIALGAGCAGVNRVAAEAERLCNAAGLTIGESNEASDIAKEVGLVLDGTREGEVSGPPGRLLQLHAAAHFLASGGRIHGGTLRIFAGHCAWVFGCEKLMFSLLVACYAFSEQHEGWAKMWPSVRSELRDIADLIWFARSPLTSDTVDVALCSDAEGVNATDNGGGAFVFAPLPAAIAEASPDEGWSAEPVKRALAGEKGPAPAEVWMRETEWTVGETRRWRYAEAIHLGETDALLLAVKRAVRTQRDLPGGLAGKRLLAFTDNATLFYALRKGRSSKWGLRRRLKELLSWTILGNFALDVRWVGTDFCAADVPSRCRIARFAME